MLLLVRRSSCRTSSKKVRVPTFNSFSAAIGDEKMETLSIQNVEDLYEAERPKSREEQGMKDTRLFFGKKAKDRFWDMYK